MSESLGTRTLKHNRRTFYASPDANIHVKVTAVSTPECQVLNPQIERANLWFPQH